MFIWVQKPRPPAVQMFHLKQLVSDCEWTDSLYKKNLKSCKATLEECLDKIMQVHFNKMQMFAVMWCY